MPVPLGVGSGVGSSGVGSSGVGSSGVGVSPPPLLKTIRNKLMASPLVTVYVVPAVPAKVYVPSEPTVCFVPST